MMIKKIFLGLNVFLTAVLVLVGLGTIRSLHHLDTEISTEAIDNYELVVPQPEVRPLSYYMEIIGEKTLFGSPPAEVSEKRVSLEALPRTALKLKLKGTIYSTPSLSRAIIKDLSSGIQSLYRPGDMIAGAKIVEIKRNRVVIERGGMKEVLAMVYGEEMLAKSKEPFELLPLQVHIQPVEPLPVHIQPLPEPVVLGEVVLGEREIAAATEAASKIIEKLRIDPRNIREVPANIMEAIDTANEVFINAKVRPHFSGARLKGIQVTDIHPGSIYERIGLRSGDVIKAVNGHPVNSIRGILRIYREIYQQPAVTISIDRGGKTITLVHRIKSP